MEHARAAGSPPTLPALLLSGAGLPPWVWDQTRALLGSTDSAVAPRPGDTTAALSDYATAALEAAPWPQFVVVAHSVGGVVAARALALAPERVAGVLGVCAVLPRPGESFSRSLPVPARFLLGPILRLAGTRPPEKAIRRGLTAGLEADVAERIIDDFRPESARLFLDRCGRWAPPAATGFASTRDDREVSEAVQARSRATLRAAWTEQVGSGHLPMLSDPAAVARCITRLAADATRPSEPT